MFIKTKDLCKVYIQIIRFSCLLEHLAQYSDFSLLFIHSSSPFSTSNCSYTFLFLYAKYQDIEVSRAA